MGWQGECYHVAMKSYLVWRRWTGNDYSQFLTEQQIQRSEINHWATCLKETRMRMHHNMKEIIVGRYFEGWKCKWISKRNQINLQREDRPFGQYGNSDLDATTAHDVLKPQIPETEIDNIYYRRDCLMFPYSLDFLLMQPLLKTFG